MKVFYVQNGTNKLVIKPESKLEEELLNEFVDCIVTKVQEGTKILDATVTGSLLIDTGIKKEEKKPETTESI